MFQIRSPDRCDRSRLGVHGLRLHVSGPRAFNSLLLYAFARRQAEAGSFVLRMAATGSPLQFVFIYDHTDWTEQPVIVQPPVAHRAFIALRPQGQLQPLLEQAMRGGPCDVLG